MVCASDRATKIEIKLKIFVLGLEIFADKSDNINHKKGKDDIFGSNT